ncbi:oligosaccharide flippase family protein [Chloroflexota bacterium]
MKEGRQFNLRSFGSDALVYATGQGLLLIFGCIQWLIIPKYLSVADYSYWQFFLLYVSYVGILHFGFIDGAHVRWAGKGLNQIGNEIKIAFRFLLFQQLVIIIPIGVLIYFLLNPPFQWIGLLVLLYAFTVNLGVFFISTAQAIRKFKLVTIVNLGKGLIFLILIAVLFSSGYVDYYHVILVFWVAAIIALFTLAFRFRRYLFGRRPSFTSLKIYGKDNINIGIYILLGNFIMVLFLTIDRLMISSFFPSEQFAIYAFALTITMAGYMFVAAISQVFFPNLSAMSTELRTKAYRLGKPAIIIVWAAILAVYFPTARLIEFYLPQYTYSLPIMQILLCTVGFGSLIQILHVSYYKAYLKQRLYFLWGITSLICSVVLNILAITIFGTLESVAVATLISFGVWYIINELSLKAVTQEGNKDFWKSILILCSCLSAFWLTSLLVDWFVNQMLIYFGLFLLIIWLLWRSKAKELIGVVRQLRN